MLVNNPNILGKKGQVEITFNWIYILIAGAVILLFFILLVVKQQESSEQKLSIEVVNTLESIFTGAGVSEKTKNFIPVGGLVDYTLYFNCEDGVTNYGIEGQAMKAQNSIDPIFSPAGIKTSQLILWSLPYKMPFKIIDFLYVTSGNTKYFVVGKSLEDDFVKEFLNASEGLNVKYVDNSEINSLIKMEKNFQVRVIDLDGSVIVEGEEVPSGLLNIADESKITGLLFLAQNELNFYNVENNKWVRENSRPIPIISLNSERDAAKYAAIFSGNSRIYECNMGKAFRRMDLVLEIYNDKFEKIKNYYELNHDFLIFSYSDCFSYLNIGDYGFSDNLESTLISERANMLTCLMAYKQESPNPSSSCLGLLDSAKKIEIINEDMNEKSCTVLY